MNPVMQTDSWCTHLHQTRHGPVRWCISVAFLGKTPTTLEMKIWYVHCIVWPTHLHFCFFFVLGADQKHSFKHENTDYTVWTKKTLAKETDLCESFLKLFSTKTPLKLFWNDLPLHHTKFMHLSDLSDIKKIIPVPFLLLIFYRNWKDHPGVIKFLLSVIFSRPLALTHPHYFCLFPCCCVYQVVFP